MKNRGINKFRLTPEKYREFKILAAELGPFQRKSKSGKPLSRIVNKIDGNGKSYQVSEQILVNHEVNLRELYQKCGQDQVDKYVASFRALKIEMDEEERLRNEKKSKPEPAAS